MDEVEVTKPARYRGEGGDIVRFFIQKPLLLLYPGASRTCKF